MLAGQNDQRPAWPGSADFLSWRYCLGQIFKPYSSAMTAAVAAVFDDQDGGSPSKGFVRQACFVPRFLIENLNRFMT